MKLPAGRLQLLPWFEGAILIAAAPFLVFPSFSTVGTVLAFLALAMVWLAAWRLTHQPLLPSPFNSSLLVLALTIVVGILVTADPDLTLPKAAGLILGLATWRFITAYLTRPGSLVDATAVLLLLGFGLALFGILSADWTAKVPALAALIERLPSRLLSLPEAPEGGTQLNQLAGTLTFYLPLLGSFIIGYMSDPNRRTVLYGAMVGALFVAGLLVLSQSRSGWIGALVGLIALMVLWVVALPRSRKRRIIWTSLALVLLAGMLTLAAIGPDRLQQFWDEPQVDTALGGLGSLAFRQEVWKWATTAVGDFPFTGTGLGTFRRVVFRLYPIAVPPSYDIAHAHNVFLQTALDLGILGLIAYLALLGTAFVIGWQVIKMDTELRPLAIGLLAGLVAFHAYGMTDALAPGSKPGIVLWFILGMVGAMARFERSPATAPLKHADQAMIGNP